MIKFISNIIKFIIAVVIVFPFESIHFAFEYNSNREKSFDDTATGKYSLVIVRILFMFVIAPLVVFNAIGQGIVYGASKAAEYFKKEGWSID